MDILKYGADCEVVGPKQLRNSISAELDEMKKAYR